MPKQKSTSQKEIAFFETEPWEQEYLEQKLKNFKLHFFPQAISKKDLTHIANISVLSPFVYDQVTAEVIKSLPKLKFITTRSTGFDHIDLKAAAAAGVQVTNVPFYGENTVAEHAFALILSLSRKIHNSYVRTSRGDFRLEGLQGFDLKGKTMGIIGGGHIGQHVARMAHGFEMNVLVYDTFPNKQLAKDLHFQYVSLSDLLKRSDVITLHAPYNKKTHHLLNRQNLKLVKPGAILVNTARGGLIDTTALVEALRTGRLAGLGLDVLEVEKYVFKEERELVSPKFSGKVSQDKEMLKTIIEQHVLINSDKVVLTQHNAFNSKEAMIRILDTNIDNILAWKNKKEIKCLVKVKK